ncbi:MAG: 5-bromo-4-chloroindolyl phosphate hydrolysis family protein [Firmicutes bacterium]|nr:5-bromo-4-chloroindolyl phosphate hydrolysis family protein [Bacillota bacterium]
MNRKTVQKTVSSPLAIYSVAVVWLLMGWLFPIYKPGFFIAACLLSCLSYFLVRKAVPGKTVEVTVEEEPPQTGVAAADGILAEGSDYLRQFEALRQKVSDPQVSAKTGRLQELCSSIFEEIRKSPDKAPQIRRFSNYFLPTSIKLLQTYVNLDTSGGEGENISGAKRDIAAALDNVETAFSKQLDMLFSGEAMDVSAEVSALQAVLAGDGLIGKTMREEGQSTIELKL